jgi:hypothetical protein
MRHETPEKDGLDSDSGAVPPDSELLFVCHAVHVGADPIAADLQEALAEWRQQRDEATLRRALLDLLLRLER